MFRYLMTGYVGSISKPILVHAPHPVLGMEGTTLHVVKRRPYNSCAVTYPYRYAL